MEQNVKSTVCSPTCLGSIFRETLRLMSNTVYLTSFFGIATLTSLTVVIIQYREAARVKKILDDYIAGLLQSVKRLTNLANREGTNKIKAEVNSLREKLITLDILNRDLTTEKIEQMEKEEKLTKTEAREYKKLASR